MASFADISHHQGSVDLAAYAARHDRIALKATEGTGFVDPAFTARWRRAGQLGLARVAYHYARNANSGAAEFDHFLRAVTAAGGRGARDWLCLDSEDTTSPGRAAAHAREFTTRAGQRGITHGLLYTGRWYAQPNHLTASVLASGWRRLWISDYTAGQADSAIELPSGWTRGQVAARQFTDRATVPGVGTPCDYNRVLNDWLRAPAPPEEDDDMTPEQARQLAAAARDAATARAKVEQLINLVNGRLLPALGRKPESAELFAFRADNDSTVYVVVGSARLAVRTPDELGALGVSWNDVHVVPADSDLFELPILASNAAS